MKTTFRLLRFKIIVLDLVPTYGKEMMTYWRNTDVLALLFQLSAGLPGRAAGHVLARPHRRCRGCSGLVWIMKRRHLRYLGGVSVFLFRMLTCSGLIWVWKWRHFGFLRDGLQRRTAQIYALVWFGFSDKEFLHVVMSCCTRFARILNRRHPFSLIVNEDEI